MIALIIFGISLLLAVISKVIQLKVIDKKKMKEYGVQLKEKQALWKSLLLEGESKKQEASDAQKQMLEINANMMKSTTKFSLISLPIFLGFFAIMGYFFSGQVFESIIPLPLFINFNFLNPLSWIPLGITTTTGFYKAYVFYYLIITIILNIIEKIYERID